MHSKLLRLEVRTNQFMGVYMGLRDMTRVLIGCGELKNHVAYRAFTQNWQGPSVRPAPSLYLFLLLHGCLGAEGEGGTERGTKKKSKRKGRKNSKRPQIFGIGGGGVTCANR